MKNILLAIMLLPVLAQGQTISTYAGNGISGYTGDGGLASTAEIYYPWGLTTDGAGNTYFTGSYYLTSGYDNVRRVNAAGIITSFAGNGVAGFSGDGGPATAAELDYPMGVASDTRGNVYILDWNNYRVRKVSAAGIITTIAGTGVSGYTGDGGPATAAQIYAPYAIACDTAGNVYIGQFYGYAIRKIDTFGVITTFAGSGSSGFSGDGGPATSAQIDMVYGLTTDVHGNVYVADYVNNRIRKVNSAGIITTIAGNGAPAFTGDGGPATAASLNGPLSLVADAAGNIDISDYLNSRVRRINASGVITTLAGTGITGYGGDGGPATAAWMTYPTGIAHDAAGNILFNDWSNYRMRMISFTEPALHFAAGHAQNLSLCITETRMSVSIDSLLGAIDTTAGLTNTWAVAAPASHGILAAAYTATSTGGTVIPAGLTYTPVSGYMGSDMFKISVTDGLVSDTTTISVLINPYPDAGRISGTDSLCPGATDTLHETASGGYWATTNFGVSYIDSSTGIISALLPGIDTVFYTHTGVCGIAVAKFPFLVRSYTDCNTGVTTLTHAISDIDIYPNPANSVITISATEKISNIIITNLLGQTVYSLECNGMQVQADVKAFCTGIYFIKVNGIYTGKFVKN